MFSASSYFGPGSNLGAYVKISSDMKVHCVQFQARKTGQDVSIRERLLLCSVHAAMSSCLIVINMLILPGCLQWKMQPLEN